jgi:hypothetical protein
MSVERHHSNDEEEEQDNNKLSFLKYRKFLFALYAAGLMPMLAGGFAAGLIWIGFNKTLLNKLMTARGIQEGADSGNSILPAQTKGSEKE